jgi:acetylornithine aminotransferase
VEPDIFTSAKGLAGGIPIGAMMCKRFCDVFEPGSHASTFGGNPLSCAAALAVLGTIERDDILQNVRERGEQLRANLKAIAARYPGLFVDVRGWGLIDGLEIDPDSDLVSAAIVKAALEEGLLIAPAGPKVLRFVPPLIVTETEVELAGEKLATAIAKVV